MLKNTQSSGNWCFVLDVNRTMANPPSVRVDQRRKKVNIDLFWYICLLVDYRVCREHG